MAFGKTKASIFGLGATAFIGLEALHGFKKGHVAENFYDAMYGDPNMDSDVLGGKLGIGYLAGMPSWTNRKRAGLGTAERHILGGVLGAVGGIAGAAAGKGFRKPLLGAALGAVAGFGYGETAPLINSGFLNQKMMGDWLKYGSGGVNNRASSRNVGNRPPMVSGDVVLGAYNMRMS